MKISIVTPVALFMVLGAAPAIAQNTGDVKLHFEYGGNATDPLPIKPNKDEAFCGKTPLVEERLLVNKANKGIKNVIVYVYMRDLAVFGKIEPANKTHTLANDKCRFDPHVIIAQTGDKLKVTNPDQVSHNANLQFIANDPQNFTIPPGQEKTVELVVKEPAPIPVECNIHPWMKSFVVVMDHPFAALSDENGDLTIKGLPVGETITLRVNHEVGSFKGVSVNGGEISRRGTFDVEIKAGLNDLGTVVMPKVEAN